MARPVIETQEREERYTVQRPIYETAEREDSTTVMEPVVSYQTQYVDQGQYVDQQVCRPGRVGYHLAWQPSACGVDPVTGAPVSQRAGLVWVPTQGPSVAETVRTWQPNVVAQQIPQTNYVAKVVTFKVPVQTCRYVDEEMVRKVPVQVSRMVTEEHVQQVPLQVCRQVVEHVDQKVPVQVCRMVAEEQVRKVPIVTVRMVTEEHVEQVPVQVCKMVAVDQIVQTPRIVEKRTPQTYTYQVPRMVVMRVPIDPPCAVSATVIPSAVVPVPMVQVPPAAIVPPPTTSHYIPVPTSDSPSDAAGAASTGADSHGQTSVMKPPVGSSGNTPNAEPAKSASQDRETKKPALDNTPPLPGPADPRGSAVRVGLACRARPVPAGCHCASSLSLDGRGPG